MDKKWLSNVLQKNSKIGFVQRILNKDKFPTLDLGGGRSATHMMSWGQMGNKYVVFPTVLYDGKKLIQFEPKEAWGQVNQSGNFIEFDTAEEADWFSKNYKQVWK